MELSKKTILLVDDEADWRARASDRLAKAGYDVVVAADASEAMLRAEEPRVGLIIVDDRLGNESGFMLMRFLHKNFPEKPTVLYTSFEYDDAMVLQIIDQGADQCVHKGSLDELVVTVSGYMT